LVRAIEVMEATGRSLRKWQEETPEPLVRDFRAFWIRREKEELAGRIAARVEAMFAAGWVEEVRGLVERYGAEAVRRFAGIGYREIGEWLGGNGIAPTIVFPNGVWERGKIAEKVKSDILVTTRQYVKRQLTWFAREPNLRKVMLSGTQPFPADVLSLP
jgi:tRNA dimethylallyltransferase